MRWAPVQLQIALIELRIILRLTTRQIGRLCSVSMKRARSRLWTEPSVDELERALYGWLANWNGKPKPFIWKATADLILDKGRRCKELTWTAH
jgi:hypothetical protein